MRLWPIPKIEFMPLDEIDERRPVALVTSQPVWEAVQEHLHLPVVWQVDVRTAIQAAWDRHFETLQGLDKL